MIKFVAKRKGGGSIIGFGLSRANMKMLMENKPVMVDGSAIGFPDFTFYILGGETEDKILEDLEKSGFAIGSKTEVH